MRPIALALCLVGLACGQQIATSYPPAPGPSPLVRRMTSLGASQTAEPGNKPSSNPAPASTGEAAGTSGGDTAGAASPSSSPAPVATASGASQSQAAAPATIITLNDALRLALRHNPTLQATANQILQSRDEEITAAIHPNPVLTWDALFLPIFNPHALNSNTLNNVSEFDLGVSYLFERGGKRHHRIEAARDQTAVVRSQVADAGRTLQFSVAQQFITALLAKANLAAAAADLRDFQHTVRINEQRYRAGDISEGDLLKIKLQLLQFQSDESAARLALVQAKAGLRQLVGFDALPRNFQVAGRLAYHPLKLSLDDLRLLALKSRPDLRAARQGVIAADSQYTLAKANGKRDLTATTTYTHVSGLNNIGLTFNMEIPIFDRNQGEIARTRAAITQAVEQRRAAREGVLTDVRNAYEAAREGDQVVGLYRSGYLSEAKQSRDISAYAYQRGATALLDFLDAERNYRDTELAYRQSLAAYMLALEQLREAAGTRNLP